MAANSDLSMIFSTTEEENDFIEEGNLELLLKNYQPSKLSKTADVKIPPTIVKGARLTDVLLGRYVSHPGNILARKIMVRNREFFRSLPDTDSRKTAADAMIGFFESKGIRFLECIGKNDHSLRHASHHAVMEKLRKALRETGIRPDRKPPTKVSFLRQICKKKPSGESSKPKIAPRTAAGSKSVPIKMKKKVKAMRAGIKTTRSPQSEQNRATQMEQQRSGFFSGSKTRVQPGDRLAIFWPDDDVYYPGTVVRATGTSVKFLYDDNEQETVDLSRDIFVKLGRTPIDPHISFHEIKENILQDTSFATHPAKFAPRRVSLSTAKSIKPIHDESIETSASSTSSSSPFEEGKSTHIQVEGSFEQVCAAPVPSLADFLRRKLSTSA